MEPKNTRDLLGCYMRSIYNGFSSFWKVVGCSPKSVTLRKVKWSTTGYIDPTHKEAKIDFDENGPIFDTTIVYKNGDTQTIFIDKRCMISNFGNFIALKRSPDFAGDASVEVCAETDNEARNLKFSQYWG